MCLADGKTGGVYKPSSKGSIIPHFATMKSYTELCTDASNPVLVKGNLDLPLGVFLHGDPAHSSRITFPFVVGIHARFSPSVNSTKRTILCGHLITPPCNTRSLAEPLQTELPMLMHSR